MYDWKSIVCLAFCIFVLIGSTYCIWDIICLLREMSARKQSARKIKFIAYKLVQKFIFVVGSALMIYGIIEKIPLYIQPFFFVLLVYTFSLISYAIFKILSFEFTVRRVIEFALCDAVPYIGILWTVHSLQEDMARSTANLDLKI